MTDTITLPRAVARLTLDQISMAWSRAYPAQPLSQAALNFARDIEAALTAPQPEPVALDIKPPNPDGRTMCIVRWMAETPHGWVGSWDKSALEHLRVHAAIAKAEGK